MGYILQALIAREKTFAAKGPPVRQARVALLAEGIALMPLTDALCAEMGGEPSPREVASGDEYGTFTRLLPGVEAWARRLSASGPVAYVEAEFHGGQGGQCALVWSQGRVVLGPLSGPIGPINQALRALGVGPGRHHDEFAAVGLGRHRFTEDWAADHQ
jgi:hypothetical protein